jgi:hypothetical protein
MAVTRTDRVVCVRLGDSDRAVVRAGPMGSVLPVPTGLLGRADSAVVCPLTGGLPGDEPEEPG